MPKKLAGILLAGILLAGFERRLPGLDKSGFDVVTEVNHAYGDWICRRLREAN